MTERGPFAHWRDTVRPRDAGDDTLPSGRPLQPGDLPPVFQFSQNSLQDYVDCARRFQLRYVIGQRWPAARSEPIEEHEHFVEQGTQFHLLVQRHLLGIPAEKLIPQDPLLKQWWDAYLDSPPQNLPTALRLPEVQLSTAVGDQRLLARFDLLAIDPGERAVIVDWKTTRYRSGRQALAARLQSRVYPFVLVEAGSQLFGGPIRPEQVSLVYWFAEDPARPEVIPYDAARHEENRVYLADLIASILAHDEDIWPLTGDDHHCRYCVYRSLCDRGVRAGPFAEIDAFDAGEAAFDFDLDEVEEIAF
jgi:hypothetical protein